MPAINGHEINVIQSGPLDGPAVILLHHGLGSARSWRKQIPALAAAGFRVIAYDRWGYGKSEGRPALSMPHFEEDRQDLQALLDALDINRAALVGHSDGGTIALHFAASNPDCVERLVSIAAHVYVEPKMRLAIDRIRQGFDQDMDFRQRFQRVHGEKYRKLLFDWYTGWTRPENLGWDMRPLLKKISCPTLVVQGLEDEDASTQHACDIAAAIYGAEVWLLPGVGHMLPRDGPEEFNVRLIEFLSASDRQ